MPTGFGGHVLQSMATQRLVEMPRQEPRPPVHLKKREGTAHGEPAPGGAVPRRQCPLAIPNLRPRDYGVLPAGVVDLVSVFFVSVFVDDAVSLQPMNATLTHSMSRIAVSFFIDASLRVSDPTLHRSPQSGDQFEVVHSINSDSGRQPIIPLLAKKSPSRFRGLFLPISSIPPVRLTLKYCSGVHV
jgi:hypothetical protein